MTKGEITERIEKWRLKKLIAKKERKQFKCPYCAKQYANRSYIGAKKHLLICAKKNTGEQKLSSFFTNNK